MDTDPEAFTNLFTQSPARFWPLTTPAPLINCWVHWERTQLLAHCQKAVVLLSVEAPGFSKQWGCRQPLPDVFSASKLSQALQSGQPSRLSEQECAGCSAQGRHVPFSCCLPISSRHCRSTRHCHQGEQGQRGEHCAGDTRDSSLSPIRAAPGSLQDSNWNSALTGGVQPGKEQVVLQWHRISIQLLAPRSQATTDNSASC